MAEASGVSTWIVPRRSPHQRARFLKRGLDVGRIAKSLHERARLSLVRRLAEKESHFRRFSRLHLDRELHGGARIQAGARVAGQSLLFHRRGITHGAISPEKHCSIAGKRKRAADSKWQR